MAYRKISARKLWLYEALVHFICLVKLLRKGFMRRLRKHTEREKDMIREGWKTYSLATFSYFKKLY